MGLSQMCCVGYLCYLAVLDVQKRRLPMCALAAGAGVAVYKMFFWGIGSFILSLAGAAVGVVFMGISKATDESFGYGDSILIIILGLYLGLWRLLCLLMAAFGLSAAFSMVMMTKGNFQKKMTLPFVPFMGAAYLLLLLSGRF